MNEAFTPEAEALWQQVPAWAKEKVLTTVWCGECKRMTAMINFSGEVAGGDLLLAARGSTWGYWINLLAGLGWFLGAMLDHLPDVLSATTYRAGLSSKAFEVGIRRISLALIRLAGLALRYDRIEQHTENH